MLEQEDLGFVAGVLEAGKSLTAHGITLTGSFFGTPPSTAVLKAMMLLFENYEPIYRINLLPGMRPVYLGDRLNKICRFCDRTTPQVTFRKVAHAIPESTGNSALRTYHECDSCNELFGIGGGIEDHFSKWCKLSRTSSQVKGKNGVPSIKGRDHEIRLGDVGLNMQFADPNCMDMDEENKRVTIKVPTEPYIPLAVLKAFHKMALSVMPESEIAEFKETIDWIRNPDHRQPGRAYTKVIHTFIDGSPPFTLPLIYLFRRRHDDRTMPYMFFVLGFGNNLFQVTLPSSKQNDQVNTPVFAMPHSDFDRAKARTVDLGCAEEVRGEIQLSSFGFESCELKTHKISETPSL